MKNSVKDLVIVGVGGWGRSVHNIVEAVNQDQTTWNFLGFLEDNAPSHGGEIHGCPVLGTTDWLHAHSGVHAIVGVGSPALRRRVALRLEATANPLATLVHPSAWVGNRVVIGAGTVVHANCVVTTDLRVGKHVLLNIASSITHDDEIEDFATLQPGVNVSGSVRIGEGTELGTGSCVIQGTQIGSWSVIGAGSAVVRDIPDNVTAVGVPAKTIKQRPAGWHESVEVGKLYPPPSKTLLTQPD